MYSRTKLERETIILFNEAEKDATIETVNRGLKRKLFKLAEQYPEDFKHIKTVRYSNTDNAAFFTVPKKYVKINAPRTTNQNQN